jgi:hypothetical protein
MSQPPKPTELIFLPKPTVLPALFAFGMAALVVGLFAWWPYSVIGGVVALFSLVRWLRTNRDEIAQMPRQQHTDTAPIPLSVSPPADQ